MDKVFDLIDQHAATLTADLNLAVNSIGGVYERVYRSDPSPRGLQSYLLQTADVANAAQRLASVSLQRYETAIAPYRTAFNPEFEGADHDIYLDQVSVAVEHVRLSAARRFRAALVSRRSIAKPLVGDLRVLNRGGRQVQAGEAMFLLARKALIDAYNEPQVAGLAYEGATQGVVITRDPQHPLSGRRFSIGAGSEDAPHYESIQSEWFHPRSNAIVSRIR